MKEYIKSFDTLLSADGFSVHNIPFVCTCKETHENLVIGDIEDALLSADENIRIVAGTHILSDNFVVAKYGFRLLLINRKKLIEKFGENMFPLNFDMEENPSCVKWYSCDENGNETYLTDGYYYCKPNGDVLNIGEKYYAVVEFPPTEKYIYGFKGRTNIITISNKLASDE